MHKTLVRDVMSTDVPAAHPAVPFKHLVALLRSRHTDSVVIVDPVGRPQGIVTAADLIIKETDPQGYGPRVPGPNRGRDRDRKKAAGAVAADVMSAPPVTIFPHNSVVEAAQVMRRHAISQLPVIQPGTGLLVGVITRSDTLGAYLRRDDEIQEEIRREILGGEFASEAADVTVTCEAGVVTLNGHVRHDAAVARLVRTVQHVEGVVRVEEHLSRRVEERFPVPPLAW